MRINDLQSALFVADGKLIQVLVNMKKYKYSIYFDDTFNFSS